MTSIDVLISTLIINVVFIGICIPCYLVYYIEITNRNQPHNERLYYVPLRQVDVV